MVNTEKKEVLKDLLKKYSASIPRYTSYPTAPEWSSEFTNDDFLKANEEGNKLNTPISLYFHLPFCESQCYFCGCNVVISKKQEIVKPYLERVIKEINEKAKLISKDRIVEQIHFGGGTPTFFSPDELSELFTAIESNFTFSENCEIGLEIDPRVTTYEHLDILSSLGFNRLSMGIQDFNPNVQDAINRVQPYNETRDLFMQARNLGFMSISVDLIYGLPHQTEESFVETLDQVLGLDPDRIALFHYAHLPQMIPHQEKYIDSSNLPSSETKIEIFNFAVEALTNNGYNFIGLDHFAKEGDELSIARRNGTLHRNFQGYTTKAGCDLYGFGITSISNIQNIYMQNIKKLNPYSEAVEQNLPAQFRGIALNKDDLLRKEVIMRILCQGKLDIKSIETEFEIDFINYFSEELKDLSPLGFDKLIVINNDLIEVTNLGQYFLRNIASAFDYYLRKKDGEQKLYSKTV